MTTIGLGKSKLTGAKSVLFFLKDMVAEKNMWIQLRWGVTIGRQLIKLVVPELPYDDQG